MATTPKFPCPNPPPLCDQEVNPSTAFNSESTDSTTFIGLAWNGTIPPLGAFFEVFPCEAITQSQISQQDADLAAARLAATCSTPCPPVFNNTAQTISLFCPDGTPYFFTLPAGVFTASSQLLADRMAFTFAEQQALAHPICITNLAPSSVCTGTNYSGIIEAITADTPVTFEIDGDLPPGLSSSVFGNALTISGNSSSFGAFTFAVKATSSFGTFTIKTFTIHVAAITTASPLDEGGTNTPYSVQLTAIMTIDDVTWLVLAGTLPDGLTLDTTTGVISGTPTTAGNSAFTIQATDGISTCTKNFTITVQSTSNICTDGLGGLVNNVYRIQGYFDGMIPNPTPHNFNPTVWDGTLPYSDTVIKWFGTDTNITFLLMSGFDICEPTLQFTGCDGDNTPRWRFFIASDDTVWSGRKVGGQTPEGVYTNDGTGDDAVPLTLTIELAPGVTVIPGNTTCGS